MSAAYPRNDDEKVTEDEARTGLWRGIRNAIAPAVFLWLVGFILGVMVIGAWSRSW